MGVGHHGQTQAPLEELRVTERASITQAVARARGRATLKFRTIVVLTWVVIVGGLVLALASAGRIDPGFLEIWAPFILGGVPLTVVIALVSIAIAVVLALLGALGRLSGRAVLYGTASLYVSLARGTPLIVQILFAYLALPQIVPVAADVPAIALGIGALAFNYGAYMTEIFRAGIQAVPPGQREAAQALGMPEQLIMRRIVLPQAIRIVIPAIGNEFIAMIKDSALVSLITVQELLWRAQRVGQSNFRSLETLLLAALVYWILTAIFSFFQERLEKRMARGDR